MIHGEQAGCQVPREVPEDHLRIVALDSLRDTRPQREHGDLSGLKASIQEVDLMHPLVVTPGGSIIAGRRRYQALRELGWERVPVRILNLPDDINSPSRLKAALDENKERKNLTPVEEVLTLRLYHEAKVAEEGRGGPGLRTDLTPVSDTEVPRTETKTATELGLSREKVNKDLALAAEILEHGDDHPRLKEIDTKSRLRKEIALIHRRDEHAARAKEPMPVSDLAAPFGVIYADPPWRYEYAIDRSDSIEAHYPTLSLEDICALPVEEIAEPDCVLFLWSPSPKLAEAISVIPAWGFSYRTCMVWDKETIGAGYYARQQHELLLIAIRGEPKTPLFDDRPVSVLRARRREHSRKPDEFYRIIERMYPLAKKVELFCRTPHPGWASWGDEVG